NIAADSSRYASTPRDAPARMPRPDASTPDAAPPSRPLHLQIYGENKSCLSEAEQVCEKWTVTLIPYSRHRNCLLSLKISLFRPAGNLPRSRRNHWVREPPEPEKPPKMEKF